MNCVGKPTLEMKLHGEKRKNSIARMAMKTLRCLSFAVIYALCICLPIWVAAVIRGGPTTDAHAAASDHVNHTLAVTGVAVCSMYMRAYIMMPIALIWLVIHGTCGCRVGEGWYNSPCTP